MDDTAVDSKKRKIGHHSHIEPKRSRIDTSPVVTVVQDDLLSALKNLGHVHSHLWVPFTSPSFPSFHFLHRIFSYPTSVSTSPPTSYGAFLYRYNTTHERCSRPGSTPTSFHVCHAHQHSQPSTHPHSRRRIKSLKKYTDETWTQEIITFDDFLVKFMGFHEENQHNEEREPPPVGYLAQHDLFAQVPRLLDDIAIPEYCYMRDVDPDDGEVNVMVSAWFGPSNTVSPLHTDPHLNLFAQVVGKKYVRLYSPGETSKLYPHREDLLGNTSQRGCRES
ncbi:hypothetical protein BC829DRAFT_193443 [Chytridium lagenaria]|nr:hypothetical protein BC829DRAFT_193443 [Chytridium lagenaria]